jgi:hypothetical protein
MPLLRVDDMAENIDYEQIYQLTFRKQWAELLELVYKIRSLILGLVLGLSVVRSQSKMLYLNSQTQPCTINEKAFIYL